MSFSPGPHVSDDALTERMIDEIQRELTYRIERADGLRNRQYHPLATDILIDHHTARFSASAQALLPRDGVLGRTRQAAKALLGRSRDDVLQLHDALFHLLQQLDNRTMQARGGGTIGPLPRPAPGGRRLGIVKPTFGSIGGFEQHVQRLSRELGDRGWEVTIVTFDAQARPQEICGLPVTEPIWDRHTEFFQYAASIERLLALDLSGYDVVLTTQPPSHLARHSRKVSLFYHQLRWAYDLESAFTEAGFVEPEFQRRAAEAVRAIETDRVSDITQWLAGSEEAAGRLADFWAIPSHLIELHRTAPPSDLPVEQPAYNPGGPVLTVGRHEWPKRVELAVAASHQWTAERTLIAVGRGTRLDAARQLDRRLAAGLDPGSLTDTDLWMNRGWDQPRANDSDPAGSVDFRTDADDVERDRLYAEASVVVCPAFREDHGHTPIEAMASGRPVVVCNDGGGLTEFVENGVTGLVVEPTPHAIAAAIDELLANPDRAESMGAEGRRRVQPLDWDATAAHLDEVLTRVADMGLPELA